MNRLKGKKLILAAHRYSCLAKCNGLDATTRFADQTSVQPPTTPDLFAPVIDGWYSSFEEFEQAAKDCTNSTDQLLAVSYSRASLGQTGSGHFSPVGGYTSLKGGMVLVLDVARFKCGVHRAHQTGC